jgi:hypothetical protein
MYRTKINLSDLKESNINQLLVTEMLLVKGGHCRRCQSRSNKCGSFSKKSYRKIASRGGCTGGVIGSGVTTTPDEIR